MSLLAPRRLLGAMAAATLLATTLVAGVAAVAPTTADAAGTSQHRGYLLKAGPNLGRGTEWMGAYGVDGRPPSYCIDYGKATPRAIAWTDVRSMPGWSATTTARISYVLSRYGTTNSNTQAAAVNAAVNLLIGDKRFAADWKSSYAPQLAKKDRNVAPLASRMLAESANLRGPYKVGVKVLKTAVVGGVAQARVTVTSATGRALGNVPLQIKLGNAMPATALPRRTAANGQAIVQYVPSAPGAVTLTAVATGLIQSGVLRVSTAASSALQRVATSATARVSSSAKSAFTARYPNQALKASMVCTQDCFGAPPIDVTATNSSARNKLQVFLVVDGKVVPGKVLTLGPGKAGKLRVVVKDGNKVALAYRWQQGRGWSRFLAYGATTVVDCPPAPDVSFTVDCPCDGKIDATLRDDNTTRYTHVLTIEIPGQATRTLTVPAKSAGSLPKITWPRGTTVTIWNQNQLAGKNVLGKVKVTTVNFG